jgi:hypothetical protein
MKTMTCRQLGGACDQQLRGESADDVIKAQDRHLEETVAGGRHGARARAEGHARTVEAPPQGNGLVPRHQTGLRRPAG